MTTPLSSPCFRAPSSRSRARGFTLTEVMVVVAIMSLLLAASTSMFKRTEAESMKTSAASISSMVERARSTAITRRKPVVLALFNPHTPANRDQVAKMAIFEVQGQTSDRQISGEMIERFTTLASGIAFFSDARAGLPNVMGDGSVSLTWRNGRVSADVPALVFTPRGGLGSPPGSESVAIVIGPAAFRDGKTIPTGPARQTIRVGRVVARAWAIDE